MLAELEQSFDAFTSKARGILAEASNTVTRKSLRVVPGAAALPEVVAALEGTTEFSALVEETKRNYRGARHGGSGWEAAVGNWFRRSGVYECLAAGDILDLAVDFHIAMLFLVNRLKLPTLLLSNMCGSART